MTTRISGRYDGKPVALVVINGEITDGKRTAAAAHALGAVAAQAEVAIPGLWSGVADLSDPYALRATFVDVLDAGSAAFDPAAAPLSTAPAGAVF